MKKLIALLLCLATLMSMLPVLAEETAEDNYQYDAMTLKQFYLRPEKNTSSKQLKKVPKGSTVNVIEYDDEWCYVEYRGKEGYCKREYLFKFHSHDPFKYTVPGYEKPYGIGTMAIEFNTKGMAGKTNTYGGNELFPGDKLTVHYYNEETDVATILVWRTYIDLPAGAMTDIVPFTDYNEAQPGDMIAGYTTYTSMKYGMPYHKNRHYNINRAINFLNGVVLKAGEEFSYNSYVGPYTKANGYKKARITGASGVGIGGGTCQISILTYSTILGLPFRIGKHSTHTDEGSNYALWVCDATVGNSRDLTFTNLLPYDVRFECTWDANGMANMMIYRVD